MNKNICQFYVVVGDSSFVPPVDNNVYIDDKGNKHNNLINIDTRTHIGNKTGTYNIEKAKGYSKYILFSTLAELLKINPNIFTEGEFEPISKSLKDLLTNMVEYHSQQNLKQQMVTLLKFHIINM